MEIPRLTESERSKVKKFKKCEFSRPQASREALAKPARRRQSLEKGVRKRRYSLTLVNQKRYVVFFFF